MKRWAALALVAAALGLIAFVALRSARRTGALPLPRSAPDVAVAIEPPSSPPELPVTPAPAREAIEGALPPVAPPVPQPNGAVSGRVVDASGGAVEGATVYLVEADRSSYEERDRDRVTRSAAGGRWSLRVTRDSTVDLGAAKEGYAPVLVLDLALSASAHVEAPDLVLGAGAAVSGQVTDPEGRPLEGVRIAAAPVVEGEAPTRWMDPPKERPAILFMPGRALLGKGEVAAETDGRGAYALRGLAAGSEYLVRPSTKDFFAPKPDLAERRVVPPEAGVDFTLVPSGVVEVRVFDRADGKPLAGATVRLRGGARETFRQVPDWFVEPVRFDRELAPGPYEATAEVRGYEKGSERFEVSTAGTPLEVEIYLDRVEPGGLGAIRVAAKDDRGMPIPQMCLAVFRGRGLPAAEANPGRGTDDASGIREIRNLEAGRYRVRVTSQYRDYGAAETEAEIAPGETTALDVVLPRTGRLEVEVKDARGEALRGYSIEFLDESGRRVDVEILVRSGLFTELSVSQGAPVPYPGRLKVGRVAPGRITVAVSHEGASPKTETVEVRAGEVRRLVVTLAP
jgi:hypothetical protein